MRSLFPLLLLSFLLHSSSSTILDRSANQTDKDQNQPERYRTTQPYTLCPVGSLIDWRPRSVASLTHVTINATTGKNGKYFERPKEFDHPFATVEYGRTCVMTLGFTARESRPILAYVGTQIPGLLETSLTGLYRLTREPRRDPINGPLPDMGVFYSENRRQPFGNCDLFKNAQHIRYNTGAGFYFVVCYGTFQRIINNNTRNNIGAAGANVMADFRDSKGVPHGKGLKWNSMKQNLNFLEPAHIEHRLKHVMAQMYGNANPSQKPVYWVNPTEFEGWSETVMPHYDLRTVIYESRFKKVRTEADEQMTDRFLISTFLNILQCILMERFYLLLRKYLL